MKWVSLTITWIILILGCKLEPDSANSSRPEEISLDSVEVILSAETDEIIANPTQISSTSEGFALYDNGLHQIQLFTENGDHITSFGNEGRGPGEFQSVSTIKSYSNQIIASDSERLLQHSFNLDGNLISTIKLDAALFTIDNDIASSSAYVSPTNGQKNSLATFTDKERDLEFNLGEPIVKTPEVADLAQWQRDFSKGKIPDYFRNRVGISAGNSYIYLFLQTEGILQQYDLKGELNWEKSLDLPEFNDEFERFISENRDNEPGKVYMLQYVYDMEQDENGIYMLLRIPNKYPTTILSVDQTGKNMQLYRFNNVEYRPSHFSISADKEWIYFLNTSQGIVYRSKWPE